MKKISYLILAILAIVMYSCSSDDSNDNFPDVKNDELAYIHIHFTFDLCEEQLNNKLYTRNVFLFYLDDKHLSDGVPTPVAFDYQKETYCAISDINHEYIFCDYHGDFTQDKDSDGKYLFSGVTSIYNYNYTSRSKLKQGKYLLVIQTAGTYFCTYLDAVSNEKCIDKEYSLKQESKDGVITRYTWF